MPELPDITVYVEALERRVVGQPLVEARLNTPFLLRSVDPPLDEMVGKRVCSVTRLGKRIVFEMEGDLYMVLHLMIAGRGRPDPTEYKIPGHVDSRAIAALVALLKS